MTKRQFKMVLNFNYDTLAFIEGLYVKVDAPQNCISYIEKLCEEFDFEIISRVEDSEDEGYYHLIIRELA